MLHFIWWFLLYFLVVMVLVKVLFRAKIFKYINDRNSETSHHSMEIESSVWAYGIFGCWIAVFIMPSVQAWTQLFWEQKQRGTSVISPLEHDRRKKGKGFLTLIIFIINYLWLHHFLCTENRYNLFNFAFFFFLQIKLLSC